MKFYDDTGLILEKSVVIKNRTANVLEFPKILTSINGYSTNKPKSIWCVVEGEQYGLNFFTATWNNKSNHCSGDHGF